MSRQEHGSGPDPAEAHEKAYQERGEQGRTQQRRNWADEAAQARTADDPRGRTPHDRSGVPSTGDESL